MAKALKKTEEDIKLCDGVIFVLDARAAYASLNKKLLKTFGSRPVVYALNKRDLIEGDAEREILADFRSKGLVIEPISGLSYKDTERLKRACQLAAAAKTEKYEKKGVVRPLRFMVAGIPNTGKSTIINTIAKSAKAPTGDKAGVTRANKWIRLEGFELLDTPGTTPPSFENQTYAKHLAYIGALSDDILDAEELALEFIEEMKGLSFKSLKEKYKLSLGNDAPATDIFAEICKNRGFIVRGGDYDLTRGARAIFDDLRKGRIGKICFERGEREDD